MLKKRKKRTKENGNVSDMVDEKRRKISEEN